MPTCREVTQLIASGTLGSAGWRRRLLVRLHLMMCDHCREYADQLRRITRALRDLSAGSPEDSQAAARVMGRLREHWMGGAQ